MLKVFSCADFRHTVAKSLRCVVLLFAGFCGGTLMAATPATDAASKSPVDERLESRLANVRDLIDEDRFELAGEELDKLVREYPKSAEVHRQYARQSLNAGYLTNSRYRPGSLRESLEHLARAIETEPDHAPSHTFQGRVFRLMKRPVEARAALEKADSIDTGDLWRQLYWGELLLVEGKHEQAEARFRKVLSSPDASDGQNEMATGGLLSYFTRTGRLDDADSLYRQRIEKGPAHQFKHGNYAAFLLCHRDDYDGAILQAVRAREIADYGVVRRTLAAALYRKWSAQVAEGELDQAGITLGQAYNLAPPEPARVLVDACGGHRSMSEVLKAMQKTGAGYRIPPMGAVMLAAEAEDERSYVPGIFALTVEGTGRSRGQAFLNSHADYRDQRNLTIRITPEGVEAFKRKYGSDPDELLAGKAIEVRGVAKRVEIALTSYGEPTGKYYYQTHVAVDDPDQISFPP